MTKRTRQQRIDVVLARLKVEKFANSSDFGLFAYGHGLMPGPYALGEFRRKCDAEAVRVALAVMVVDALTPPRTGGDR